MVLCFRRCVRDRVAVAVEVAVAVVVVIVGRGGMRPSAVSSDNRGRRAGKLPFRGAEFEPARYEQMVGKKQNNRYTFVQIYSKTGATYTQSKLKKNTRKRYFRALYCRVAMLV